MTGHRDKVSWRLVDSFRNGLSQQASLSNSHRCIDAAQLLDGEGTHAASIQLLQGHDVQWPDKREDTCEEC
jgi:hypothetical protein